MQKKITTILASIILVSSILTGCGKTVQTNQASQPSQPPQQIQPFQTSPENAIVIKSIDNSIANRMEEEKFYHLYFTYKTTGKMPSELQNMMTQDGEKLSQPEYQSKYEPLFENGVNLSLRNAINQLTEETVEKGTKEIIDDYITATRENKQMNKEKLRYEFSPDFFVKNPDEKVKEYMSQNKIVVKSVDFSKTFESKDLWCYPQVFTYKYTINGEIGGKAFKTNVCQDFYFQYSFDDNRRITMLISYIKDHPLK